MGCDVHMYVEYKRKENNDWRPFGGRINPGRNYWMFGLMSKGVRCEFEESLEPKGMPNDPAYKSRYDNLLFITETGDGEGECALGRALTWEQHGCKITYQDGKPTYVTHPDHHSHTWLTVDEYQKVIDLHNSKDRSLPEPEYEALLAAMKRLAEFGNDVRVVVWFDN